ncbi:uncharacterized protein EV420DRAFT_103005 [Desarmillaria tabescens]|uniref:Uncharacterized protein n=1 Tax=Armillaria tabescens TaxID=1929756 RepID=A0AA39U414_ARMTA|nr:uncharacterized protein EV420DRAFT_103005 [Desarmillaria tabescens]KAK0470279.1 hypothetical protein EV420DRAFT_103005 [Desarmillaria tabescens]
MPTGLYNPFNDSHPAFAEYKAMSLAYAEAYYDFKPAETQQKKSWLSRVLCFSLHAGLVFIHLLLLLICITGVEHNIVFPIGKDSDILSTVIVQASQVIVTIYLAVLVFVSQQLATRRNLQTRQTLTATHDNISAWTGLGAALLAIWRQTSIAASVVGALCVAAYFVFAAVLHITTPAIFSLQPFNTTRYTAISTTLGAPNISVKNLGSSNPSSFFLDSTPVIPYLSNSDRISKIGLENGTLYDVLSDNPGQGDVHVNAVTFNVSCGYVDGASVAPINSTGNWTVGTVYDDQVNPIPVLAPNTIKWLSFHSDKFQDPSRNVMFYTSANITDSQGSTGNLVDLNPPMRPGANMDSSRKNVSYFDETTVYTMQLIGCTVTLVNQSAVVDAQTRLLRDVHPLGHKVSSTWSQWDPVMIPGNATVSSSPKSSTAILGRGERAVTPRIKKRQGSGSGQGSPTPAPAPPDNTPAPDLGPQNTPQPQPPSPNPPSPDQGPPTPLPPDSSPMPPPQDTPPSPNPNVPTTPPMPDPGAQNTPPPGSAPSPSPSSPDGLPPLSLPSDRVPQVYEPQDPNAKPASQQGQQNPSPQNNPPTNPSPQGPPSQDNSPQNPPPQNNAPQNSPPQNPSQDNSLPQNSSPQNSPSDNSSPQSPAGNPQTNSGPDSGSPPSPADNAAPGSQPQDTGNGVQDAGNQGATPDQGSSPVPGSNPGSQPANGNTPADQPGSNGNPNASPGQDNGNMPGSQPNPSPDTPSGNTGNVPSFQTPGASPNAGTSGGNSPSAQRPGPTNIQPGNSPTGQSTGAGTALPSNSRVGSSALNPGTVTKASTSGASSAATHMSSSCSPSTTTSSCTSGTCTTTTVMHSCTTSASSSATASHKSASSIGTKPTATGISGRAEPEAPAYYDMPNALLDVWWNLFDQAAISRFPSTDDCPGFPWTNPESCNPLTVVEQFVMENLGLHPTLLDSPVRQAPQIALHDLENSLASATAASYWAALYAKAGGLKDDDPNDAANSKNIVATPMTGNATIAYAYTATRLNINLLPLLAGLVASICLLLLSFRLVGKGSREGEDSDIDAIGVLQILWLMSMRPDLQKIISEVDDPTVDNLRKSGMVNTSLHRDDDDVQLLAPVALT